MCIGNCPFRSNSCVENHPFTPAVLAHHVLFLMSDIIVVLRIIHLHPTVLAHHVTLLLISDMNEAISHSAVWSCSLRMISGGNMEACSNLMFCSL